MKRLWQKLCNWELWPFYVIYSPLGFVWIYYAIKARAFWFFSPVNPTLEFSGFEGESKREMYEQLPPELYPRTCYISKSESFEAVKEKCEAGGFRYPFIVKPQIGMQGMLFRKIDNEAQLKSYHEHIPVDYMLQDLVDLPMEFSVFHIRYPGTRKGMVTGFIQKEYLEVRGDGQSTLLELIRNHPRACHREAEMRHKHESNLGLVLAPGQRYFLSIAGNHNRGARFINLHAQIDDRLCAVFDQISVQAGHFYYGRYDLKCTSVEDLKAGRNITILEYNGAGAEPNHIYDCNMRYWDALKTIVQHWEHLYQIGRINNRNGVPYWSYVKGRRYLKKASSLFKTLQEADEKYM